MKLRGSRLLGDTGKMDQKLTGWSDRLSNLLDFLPKMDAALWALIGITGGTTFVSSLLVQTSANAGQGEQSSRRGERAWSPIRIRTMPPSLTSSTAKRKRMPASARSPLCQPRPRSRRAHRRSHRDRGGQYRDQHAAGRHDVSVSARAEFGACVAALNAIQARRPSQGSNLPWADLRNDIARYVELRCQKGAMSALAPRLRKANSSRTLRNRRC
jgi:hypothetical protein